MGPRSAWLVRAGRGCAYTDDFERLGVVTIGWARIPGIGDLRDLDDVELLMLLRAANRGQPRADIRELLDFRDGLRVGDLVLTPDTPAREVLAGEVTGPYDYAPGPIVGEHRHLREVSWRARVPRDQMPPALMQRLRRYQRTVLRLPEQSEGLGLVPRIAHHSSPRLRHSALVASKSR